MFSLERAVGGVKVLCAHSYVFFFDRFFFKKKKNPKVVDL